MKTLTVVLLASCLLPVRPAAAEEYDLLIKGGRVVDGTGAPWWRADVAVVLDGEGPTGARPGRVLRGAGASSPVAY